MKYTISVLALALPVFAFAQTTFTNPIVFGSVQGLVTAIVQALIVMLIPIVVFFVIFAGFKYVTARGNPNDIKQANQALMYAIIGGVIIIGAFAITQIVVNTVNEFRPSALLLPATINLS